MVNESRNSTDDSSEGGLSRCESTDPLNALGRNVGGDGSDSDDDEEDPEEDIDGTETRE